MSKKILSIIMTLIIATSIIGCGNTSDKDNKSQEKSKTTETEEKATEEVEEEDKDLKGVWAEDYTLEQTRGFFNDYLKRMEDVTKQFGLKYSKDEKITKENGQKVTDNSIYFDNEKPEKNKIESMYFGMKTYGDNLTSGKVTLKLSLNFDGEGAIKDGNFDLGTTAFAKYIEAITGKEKRDYSDINKQIIDSLKNGKEEVKINNTIDGLKEEIIANKKYIIYTLSSKKYIFSKAEMSMN